MVLNKFPTSVGHLYYGPLPTMDVLKELHRNKVYAIWNLGKELQMIVDYEKTYVPEVIQANIQDYSVPSNINHFLNQINYVALLLKQGKKVFVHCMGGHGRTGTAVAALKIALDGIDPEDALHMTNKLVNGPETDEQEDFIIHIAPYLTGKQTGRVPEFKKKQPSFNHSPYQTPWYMDQFQPAKPKKIKQLPQKMEERCKFCGDPKIETIQGWNAGSGIKKFPLCKMCSYMWNAANDDERDEWID